MGAAGVANPFISAIQGIGANTTDPVFNASMNQYGAAQQLSQALHGVNLSNYASSLGFHETPNDFANQQISEPDLSGIYNAIGNMGSRSPTGSASSGLQPVNFSGLATGLATSPSTATTASAPKVGGGGGLGGLLSGLMNNVVKPAYNDLSGGLQGWNTNGFQGMVQGFEHPAQAHQAYNAMKQQVDSSIKNPVQKWAANTLYDTTSSPLTYMPIAGIAKVAGITPALKFGADLLKGTVKTADAGKAAAEPVAQAAAQAAKKTGGFASPLSDAQAKALNDWAGITGATPAEIQTIEKTVPTTIANFAKPGAYKTQQQVANDLLTQVFNIGKQSALPPGREAETLQGILSSIAPKTGVSLNDLIDQSTQFKNMSGLIPKANMMKAAGLDASTIAPQILGQGTKTVTEALPQAENGFVLRGGPLTVIPQALKDAASATTAAQAPKIGPYAAYAWQSKVGAPVANALKQAMPKGVPVLNKALNFTADNLGRMFQKYHGASPQLVKSLLGAESAKQGDQLAAQLAFRNLIDEHGLTAADMAPMARAIQGLQSPANDKIANAIPAWRNLMENFKTADGRALGTNAELNTTDVKGNPLLPGTMENYYPLRYNDMTPAQLDEAMKQYIPQKDWGKFSTNGKFAQDRVFANSDQAKAAGFNPEMNPLKAGFQRIGLESSDAIRNADLLHEIVNSGIATTDHLPGYEPASIPQLSGHFMKPADNAALKSFMEPWQAKGKAGTVLGAFDKLNQGWKKGFTYNPIFHMKNVLYNGMYLGGARPQNVLSTMKSLYQGQPDEWAQRALSAGAFSADRGSALQNGFKSIDNALNSASATGASKVGSFLKYGTHDMLWDLDKALRTDVFRQAVESGKSDSEAAQIAKKQLVDYGNLTPFEKNVIQRIAPFYAWRKGNVPLQVQTWMNNPVKQVLAHNAVNAASQVMSGQPADNRDRMNTGINLPGGYHATLDLGTPNEDVNKLLADGAGSYAWSMVNPVFKEIADQALNRAYYPGQTFTPSDKPGMGDIPIHKPGTPNAAADRLSHAITNLLPFGGNAVAQMTGLKQPSNKPQIPLGLQLSSLLTGMYPGTDNPAMDQYYQEKYNQQLAQNKYSYDKSHNIPIPATLKKAAYGKIPFPASAGN